MRQLIFAVDGDAGVCELARQCLENVGYGVRTFTSAYVIDEIVANLPSLVLISLMLPDGSGIELCRQIRDNSGLAAVPIVFLLGDAAEEHRILALESGGDDCIVKPFSPRELVARVQAVLRRFSPSASTTPSETADIIIDSWAMKLSVRGTEIPTTSLEFRLLEYLARHRGQVFTRDLLLDAVWGDMQFVTPRSVDACIRRIREKIEPDRTRPTYLKTIRGVGYRLDAIAAWQSASTENCDCAACTAGGTPRLAYSLAAKRKRQAAHP